MSSTSSTCTNPTEDTEKRTNAGRRWHISGPGRAATCSLLLVAGGLLAACGSSSGQSITLYSGQHVQTTDALVSAFEKATGITVNVRPGDEDDLANQIVVEGSHSPADVIFTENSPALEYLQSEGIARSTRRVDACGHSEPVQLSTRRLGRGLGARECAHLQPEPDLLEPTADLGPSAGGSEVQGRARLRAERDRFSAHRHLGREGLWQGAGT